MNANKRKDPNTIILGSGNLYFAEFNTATGMPTRANLCKDENRLGYIKGGASLEYSAESTVVSDDLQKVSKTRISSAEATFKSGILTWNGIVLATICATATVDETTESGYRHVKIGGAGSDNGKSYALCFHHEDPEDGDIWLVMRAKGTGSFELNFAQDDGSVLDAEFTCLSQDANGTLVDYVEEIGTTTP